MADDDDIPQLPADTLLLLEQFKTEKDTRAEQFEKLKSEAEANFQNDSSRLNMDLFGEDWNASQFWYTEGTASTLASQLLEGATSETSIALVSAPSVYVALRNILVDQPERPRPKLRLLEFDERFRVLGPDFLFYDFQHPLRLAPELKGQFDRILCDPPFLSEDCQTKTALTVRTLARQWMNCSADSGLRFISCTGERMEETILKLYSKIGTRTTTFEPKHTKGLSNEFRCYANFTCDDWEWQ